MKPCVETPVADKRVFDRDQLFQSVCDDRELAAQVVGVFLTDIPEQLSALAAALDAGDAKTAERSAHSVKGASATVGGEALRAVALECEVLGKNGDLAGMRAKMDELRAQYGVLENALRADGFAEE